MYLGIVFYESVNSFYYTIEFIGFSIEVLKLLSEKLLFY
jgi:hypothetical protein